MVGCYPKQMLMIISLIREALENLVAAKLRSFLALLGIIVGTGSVVALVSIGQLATKEALDHIRALGTDLFSISFYQEPSNSDQPNESNRLSEATFTTMQQALPEIKRIGPYTTTYQPISFAGEALEGSIIGANNDLHRILKIHLAKGRFISHLDRQNFYAVIGHDVHEALNKHGINDPIGQQIQIGQHIFTIIGVAAPWTENGFFHQNINRSVIIPIPSSQLINPYTQLTDAVLQIDESADPEKLEQAIKEFIEQRFTNYHLYAFSAKQIMQSLTSQQQTFTLLLGSIGGISLLVGGIGVMNIMLMSVVERRREIGIRRAIGAKRRDIQWLFLVESVTLTLLGGICGVLIGSLGSYIVSRFAGWGFTFFLLPPVIGFSVSVAIGIFFGYYPAYKASRLDPIQSLRVE